MTYIKKIQIVKMSILFRYNNLYPEPVRASKYRIHFFMTIDSLIFVQIINILNIQYSKTRL